MTALKKFVLFALLALPAPVCRAEEPAAAPAQPAQPAQTPVPPTAAPAPANSLDRAEQLARNGDWEKARQLYKEQLAAKDPASLPPSFFFNYGTILAKAGAPGEAYVALMRAAFAMPFDSDTKHNLRLAENQVPATVRAVEPASWYSWWPGSLRGIPWKLWVAIGLLASAAFLALARLLDRTVAASAGVVALALLAWGGLAWSQQRLPVYGVMALTKVKSGPANTFSDILQLEPGSLVNEEIEKDGWLKIRFQKSGSEEDSVGWVEPASVLRVL